MKKLIVLTLLIAVVLTAPAFADDTPSGVASDVTAVQQDNQALSQSNTLLAKDRAAKAQDKATGNWMGEAVDSVKIGVDKLKADSNETQKSADSKTLNSDVGRATHP